jgi:hypothetical protein
MKHLIISPSLAAGFMALSTMESSALVCARGVYHAGCVARGGAGPSDVPSPALPSSRHGGPSFAAGCTDFTHRF